MQENERVDAEIARRTFNTFNMHAPSLTVEELCEVLRSLLAGLHFLLSILRFPCCKRSENHNAPARASKLIADYAGLGDEQRQHFSALQRWWAARDYDFEAIHEPPLLQKLCFLLTLASWTRDQNGCGRIKQSIRIYGSRRPLVA